MNPHRIVWGALEGIPFALIIGVLTFLAWFISRESKTLPMMPLTVMMIVFLLWTGLTTVFAASPESAREALIQYVKIMSMTFLTVILFQDRQRLTLLLWVIAFSIGYYGIKGGVFGLLTGGENRIWGPTDSFISDNNALAMALLMILPFIRYLQLHSAKRWIRLALLGTIPLLVVSVLASYSRGAFVGLAVTSLYLAAKSRHRIRYGLLILVALVGALSLMPDKFFDRMNTIETYEVDASAQSRLASWQFGLNVAAEHPYLEAASDSAIRASSPRAWRHQEP